MFPILWRLLRTSKTAPGSRGNRLIWVMVMEGDYVLMFLAFRAALRCPTIRGRSGCPGLPMTASHRSCRCTRITPLQRGSMRCQIFPRQRPRRIEGVGTTRLGS